jgi:pyruvate, orthophosphate dikinase
VKYVYRFDEGDGSMKDLLGGKGAGLAEMTRLGLRVPPGFTVTTDACREVMRNGTAPDEMWDQIDEALAGLEEGVGRTFGGGPVPLLVSVRSGARFSMPGMMDTVLNLGINDEVVGHLTAWTGNPHFAWDAYRRFVQMFGNVVLATGHDGYQRILTELRSRRGVEDDSRLTAEDLEEATRRFQDLVVGSSGFRVPADPRAQLRASVSAVFESWNNRRARDYRKIHGIPDDLGTAANVQMMVFGDLGDDSGTGVCFTRDPATGDRRPFGDYLQNAQGEDVVAGLRNTLGLDDLGTIHADLHRELLDIMDRLERHYSDMCDIEFTIEKGTLWILQTRVGKRTAAAAVRLAVGMAEEGLIDRAEAVRRVEPAALEQLERPRIDETHAGEPVATGVAASPGAAVGKAVFDADTAVAWAARGEVVILVRPETTPDDIHGMAAAAGILTSQGGKTSHAAVVARGMGKPAVTGAATVVVDVAGASCHVGSLDIREGAPITIDGTAGRVFSGEMPLVEPESIPELDRLLAWADAIRTLGVRANADTPADAAKARAVGAEGIGLARTEHMFLGERVDVVRRIILNSDPDDPAAATLRAVALAELMELQAGDFEGLLEAMDGLPVVVRLLDPPLHEFLPPPAELEHEMVRRVWLGRDIGELQRMATQAARLHEDNPMMGLRGVRLGLMFPDLYRMQVDAALRALVRRLEVGGDPRLEIMIPLVVAPEELRRMREMIEGEVARASRECGRELHVPIGTMIELPRAALMAGRLARVADFFSFGTNDLTQMTYGLSRDDAEGLFLRTYLEDEILTSDPFQTIDPDGVGRLIRVAVSEGREANPAIGLGVCGEHGGDPESIGFCRRVGLDYVSCSPPRVHVARLAAAQAELGVEGPDRSA